MKGVYRIYPNKRGSFFRNLSITTNLIIINVVAFVGVFIGAMFLPRGFVEQFIAIDPFYILKGKYLWTFLTSMFMHGGFFHLFANMFSLFFIGSLIERILGKKRYLYFYLIAGLSAGLLFVLVYLFTGDLNVHVPAVGASGALFGLIGLLVLLTPDLPVYIMFIPIPIKMKYAGPGILIVLWFISKAASIPIGNTAHLGGLIVGLIYGMYLKTNYKNKTREIRNHFH